MKRSNLRIAYIVGLVMISAMLFVVNFMIEDCGTAKRVLLFTYPIITLMWVATVIVLSWNNHDDNVEHEHQYHAQLNQYLEIVKKYEECQRQQ